MTRNGTAVVVGAGINGLVAGAILSRQGRRVVVLERSDRAGGLVRTDELTLPGYLHDTFSSWHGTFLSGPAWPLLRGELEARGLVWRRAEGLVTATVRHDGTVAMLHRDPRTTASQLRPGDQEAYLALVRQIHRLAPHLSRILGAEPRSAASARALLGIARSTGVQGISELVRTTVSGARNWLDRQFDGDEIDAIVAPWLLHAGMAPGDAGGPIAAMMLLGGLHAGGMPVLTGGSGRLTDALVGIIEANGGKVRLEAEVTEIAISGGRVTGVLVNGVHQPATCVLASVTPDALYNRLLPEDAVPLRVRTEARRFRRGRGAMQIHVALTRPLAWRDPRLAQVPLVHLSDGSASVALACAQAEAGLLPCRPTVVIGQQHVLDPSRVPAGAAALWLQLQEVPSHPRGDAGDPAALLDGWTETIRSMYVDRVLDLVDRHAPGTRDRAAAVVALTPPDLERHDVNVVGGDPYGGAATLDQSFLWRPLGSAPAHRTAVAGLWHIGASTHPGPGLSAASAVAATTDILAGTQGARLRRWRQPSRTHA